MLIGLGLSRQLLWLQLLLNALNIGLDVLFAGVLGWGARGIAFGTAISEWVTCLVGLVVLLRVLSARRTDSEAFWPRLRIWDASKVAQTLSANRDIMLRTILLLFGFGLFTRQGAQYGDAVLAANHVLLQLVSFSAFFLDGFANVAESLVGRAFGRRHVGALRGAVLRSTQLAAFAAVILALGIALGTVVIDALSDQTAVTEHARHYRFYAAAYVLLSFAAFQLDGVFVGAGRARDMRNASAVSLLIFVAAWWLLAGSGNAGLWQAFIIYVVARAAALGVRYPRLLAAARATA